MKTKLGIRGQKGFTLIELLVVIAIIAILAAMLLPALAGAKEKGKQAYCINSLKQLNIIFHMYEDENEGWLHHTPNGSPPNHGKWYMNPRMKAARKLIGSSATQWANPNSGDAYWGLAYYKYAGGNIRLWRCPAAKTSDEWREDGLKYGADFWLDASYGINGRVLQFWFKTVSWHQRLVVPESGPTSLMPTRQLLSRMLANRKWTVVRVTTWPPTALPKT